MRLFFALDIDENLQQQLLKLTPSLQQQLMGENIKWVPQKNWHLTLRFLGEVAEEEIPALIQSVKTEIQSVSTFILPTGKINYFPPNHSYFLALTLPLTMPLAELYAAINRGLEHHIVTEKRSFLPHITLAYLKKPAATKLISNFPIISATLLAKEVILYRSDNLETGSVYTPLVKIPLLPTTL